MLVEAVIFAALSGGAATPVDEAVVLLCEGKGTSYKSSIATSIPVNDAYFYRISPGSIQLLSPQTHQFTPNICVKNWYKCTFEAGIYSYSLIVPNKDGQHLVLDQKLSIDAVAMTYKSSINLVSNDFRQESAGTCRKVADPTSGDPSVPQ